MKIVRLEAQNVKRLTAVDITPQGNTVVIGGKNGAGKTSVLDAITYALAGKSTVCEHPVRRGAAKAKVICELDDFTVTRTFTATGGGTLTITGKDGAKAASPQALLDKLAGSLTFDPLAFTSMPRQGQVETLRGLVGLDFSVIDARREELYADRAVVGRDVQGRKSQIEKLPEYSDAPVEEVKVSNRLDILTDAENRNRENDRKRRELIDMENMRRERVLLWKQEDGTISAQIADLAARIEVLRGVQTKRHEDFDAKSEMQTAEISKARVCVAALADIDTTPIRQQIAEAETVNAKVRANATKRALAASFTRAKAEYDRLTEEIDKIDATKRDNLAAAKFPVGGLSFDDTGVLFNGLPFDQASSAERLRVSVAMALALNPTLRVALIRDGSLLDDDSLKMVAEMAAQADAQVWIERVGEGRECQVVIEDGHIQGQETGEGANTDGQ